MERFHVPVGRSMRMALAALFDVHTLLTPKWSRAGLWMRVVARDVARRTMPHGRRRGAPFICVF